MNAEVEELRARVDDLAREVAVLKNSVRDEEGELTEWAKRQLKKARAEPEDSYVSMEELRAEILGK